MIIKKSSDIDGVILGPQGRLSPRDVGAAMIIKKSSDIVGVILGRKGACRLETSVLR